MKKRIEHIELTHKNIKLFHQKNEDLVCGETIKGKLINLVRKDNDIYLSFIPENCFSMLYNLNVLDDILVKKLEIVKVEEIILKHNTQKIYYYKNPDFISGEFSKHNSQSNFHINYDIDQNYLIYYDIKYTGKTTTPEEDRIIIKEIERKNLIEFYKRVKQDISPVLKTVLKVLDGKTRPKKYKKVKNILKYNLPDFKNHYKLKDQYYNVVSNILNQYIKYFNNISQKSK